MADEEAANQRAGRATKWILGVRRTSTMSLLVFDEVRCDMAINPHVRVFLIGIAVVLIGVANAVGDDAFELLEPSIDVQPGQRLLREEILEHDIRPDGGAGYVARVRLNRCGDKHGGPSHCRLLEDGKELPHPRSLHAEIRELGEGRYSDWTESSVYFSTSDSTDPRTNGRKYELVSDESFVRKTAVVSATSLRSSFTISTPESSLIRQLRTTIINRDPQVAVTPRWMRRGDPDLTSIASILASIINERMSDEQKAIAIWKFLVDWRYHDYPAENRGEVHDPVKLVNVYGYGFCDDSAAAFCRLVSEAGIKARSYGLAGHVVAEAFYGNAWHMFDPDHQVFYRNENQEVASVSELERNPEWITHEARDPIGADTQMIAEIYTTRNNNRSFEADYVAPSVLRMVLNPGDQVEFDFDRQEKAHRRIFRDQPLPRSFANGTWSTTIPQAGKQFVRWPYVMLGGRVVADAARFSSDASMLVSRDGRRFDVANKQADGTRLSMSIDSWIERQPTATYQCWLDLRGANPILAGSTPKLQIDFQFAPRAHAQVEPGKNEFELFLQSPDDQSLATWKGVDLEIAWDEVAGQ